MTQLPNFLIEDGPHELVCDCGEPGGEVYFMDRLMHLGCRDDLQREIHGEKPVSRVHGRKATSAAAVLSAAVALAGLAGNSPGQFTPR